MEEREELALKVLSHVYATIVFKHSRQRRNRADSVFTVRHHYLNGSNRERKQEEEEEGEEEGSQSEADSGEWDNLQNEGNE